MSRTDLTDHSNRCGLLLVWIFVIFVSFLSACSAIPVTQQVQSPQMTVTMGPTVPLRTNSPTAVTSITPPPAPTLTFTLAPSLSPTPDTRPLPFYWREWPVVPELSPNALSILEKALHNPDLDLHAFSKVGDCQMTPATFLGGFVSGVYAVPPGFEGTVSWFSKSMSAESVTAANGLGVNSVLDPLFGLAAGHSECQASETPLDCELRTRHPALVLISMGTNWVPQAEASFDKYLRIVIGRILQTGALPMLATKADDIEGDWKLDQVIAQVAYDYDLPLVNVWRSVQDLPNHGLVAPKNEYLLPDGWLRRDYAWLGVLEKVRLALAK